MSYPGLPLNGLAIEDGRFLNFFCYGSGVFSDAESSTKLIVLNASRVPVFTVNTIDKIAVAYDLQLSNQNSGFIYANASGNLIATESVPYSLRLTGADSTSKFEVLDSDNLTVFKINTSTDTTSFYYNSKELQLGYNSASGFPMMSAITATGDYIQFPRLLVGGQNSSLIDSDLSFQFRRINGNVSHYMNSTGSFFTNASIATQIIPTVDNAVKLGSTSFRWSEVNAFNATLRGDVVITGTNSIGKLQVYNASGLQIMGISTTTSAISMYYTTITGDLTISSLNSATKFRIRDNTPNDLLVFDTTTPKLTIGNATRPVTVNFANGTASSFMKLDASLNLTYDTNTYLTTAAAAATYLTKVSPIWTSGSFSTPLTASSVVVTNASSVLSTVSYSQSSTANSIVQRDSSSGITALDINCRNVVATGSVTSASLGTVSITCSGLTPSQLVATDAFGVFSSIPYATAATLSTIVQRDAFSGITAAAISCSSINCSGLTATRLVATDGSKNFTSLTYATAATANAMVQRDGSANITVAGITSSSINCSGLTASYLVATDASKNFVSVAYDTAATGGTIVQRNVGGGIIINALTSTSISCSGITCSGLTATRLVATDGSKNFVSLTYATAATASAMVQRDASANITVAGITSTTIGCTSITATGNVSIGGTNNASKFNVSDSVGNAIINVSTVASGGFCPVDMDTAKLSIGNLSTSSFVQTDSSGYLTTSKTLSGATFSTSATLSCHLIPGTTNTYNLGSTSSVMNTIYTSYLGFGGATTWDLNMQLQAPNAVFSQARCPAWNTYSNLAMKENITTITNALETVQNLRAVNFTWRKGFGDNLDPRIGVDSEGNEKIYTYTPKPYMGFIAEEICEVLPFACNFDENNQPNGVDYSKVVPLLVAAVQELSARLAVLEA